VIYPDATALIGRTPILELSRPAAPAEGRRPGKLEMLNPCGSVKGELPGLEGDWEVIRHG
jgi:cysteine synthase